MSGILRSLSRIVSRVGHSLSRIRAPARAVARAPIASSTPIPLQRLPSQLARSTGSLASSASSSVGRWGTRGLASRSALSSAGRTGLSTSLTSLRSAVPRTASLTTLRSSASAGSRVSSASALRSLRSGLGSRRIGTAASRVGLRRWANVNFRAGARGVRRLNPSLTMSSSSSGRTLGSLSSSSAGRRNLFSVFARNTRSTRLSPLALRLRQLAGNARRFFTNRNIYSRGVTPSRTVLQRVGHSLKRGGRWAKKHKTPIIIGTGLTGAAIGIDQIVRAVTDRKSEQQARPPDTVFDNSYKQSGIIDGSKHVSFASPISTYSDLGMNSSFASGGGGGSSFGNSFGTSPSPFNMSSYNAPIQTSQVTTRKRKKRRATSNKSNRKQQPRAKRARITKQRRRRRTAKSKKSFGGGSVAAKARRGNLKSKLMMRKKMAALRLRRQAKRLGKLKPIAGRKIRYRKRASINKSGKRRRQRVNQSTQQFPLFN